MQSARLLAARCSGASVLAARLAACLVALLRGYCSRRSLLSSPSVDVNHDDDLHAVAVEGDAAFERSVGAGGG